mmetsp:Transcript_50834/g.87079  ORF Transcript_50834/g.87079 Transcript_50834/m.87079 type:complete len:89 (+) Transcript_50834:514-780(+)
MQGEGNQRKTWKERGEAERQMSRESRERRKERIEESRKERAMGDRINCMSSLQTQEDLEQIGGKPGEKEKTLTMKPQGERAGEGREGS